MDKALAAGISPIEVMLENMRFYHEKVAKLVADLISSGVPAAEGAPENPHGGVIEAVGQVLGCAS